MKKSMRCISVRVTERQEKALRKRRRQWYDTFGISS